MTAAQDEAWIQGSLARLETLEAQREKLAAAGQTAALAEIDEEIRALYEVLESAAGEEQAAAALAPAPVSMAPAPAMAPAPMSMAPAPAMAPAPMSMAPAPSYAAAPSDDAIDDDKPSRSMMPLVLVGVLVLGGGGAAAFMMLGNKDKEAKPVATEPAKVIKSGEIVEDTQEPVVAKGANADRTAGTKLEEPTEGRPDARRPASGSNGNSPAPRPRPTKKGDDDARKLEVEKSRDPLAGI